jgi:hypothetical protein
MNPTSQTDRRGFLKGAGLAMAATSPLLLAACGDDDSSSSDVDEANDLKIVQAGQAREWGLVGVYTHIQRFMGPDAKPLTEKILAQATSHAKGLGIVVGDLDGKPVQAKSAQEYAADFALGSVRDQSLAIAAAVRAENLAARAYIEEIPKLTIGDLRSTWTSLSTSSAQHQSVLLGIVFPGRPARQVPTALFAIGEQK